MVCHAQLTLLALFMGLCSGVLERRVPCVAAFPVDAQTGTLARMLQHRESESGEQGWLPNMGAIKSRAGDSRALQGMGRRLQQEGEVTVVTTAEALQEAVVAGKPHIEIQAHLDLTTLDKNTGQLLGTFPAAVKSFKGNCTGEGVGLGLTQTLPTAHAPLRPLLPRQCLLIVDHDVLLVIGSKLWLDGLYVRLSIPRDTGFGFDQFVKVAGRTAEVWMTNVTLQGNGGNDSVRDCWKCGLDVEAGSVYAEGCTFADFEGDGVAFAYQGGAVSMVKCTFEDNTLFPYDEYGAAVIQVDADDAHGDPEVRLEGCTFSGNGPSTVPTLLADNRGANSSQGVFYSDSSSESVCAYEAPLWNSTLPPCDISKPLRLAEAGDSFLNASNAWLLGVQQAHRDSPASLFRLGENAPQHESTFNAATFLTAVATLAALASCCGGAYRYMTGKRKCKRERAWKFFTQDYKDAYELLPPGMTEATLLRDLRTLRMLAQQEKLTHSHVQLLEPHLTKFKSLTKLELQGNDLDPRGAKWLGPCLAKLTSLRGLYIYEQDKMSCEGAKDLGPHVAKLRALTVLDLHSNNIGSVGAQALGPHIRKLSCLQTLKLHNNSIGNEGVNSLWPHLVVLTDLAEVSLADNGISSEVIKERISNNLSSVHTLNL